MKTLKMISKMSLIAVMFLALSCSSDSDGGGGGTASVGTITAKVGGSSFTSMTQGTQVSQITAGGTTTITMLGADASGKAISLTLHGVSATGTYQIGGENLISIIGSYVDTNIQNPQASVTYVAPTEGNAVMGSITVSELTDAKIVGTFNFTGTSDAGATKAITNGAFNLEF
ncbi:DUF6252 family protein [Flavobacterium pallidum]|uniref:Uncharacterized protein n=1 Tax=Flavobacterium pallidum TaxID=2172098 RepID=A0A2S1SDW7_9FLAO|nr:DUF6252 family protein [Flavobacterium pallidum]AWI24564.1 hypothetical protein HYN49_00900 [Flavobacterium pallidum]